jgi:transmembrane sensor
MKEAERKQLLDYFRDKNAAKDNSFVNSVFCDESRNEELKNFLSDQFCNFSEDDLPGKKLDHILYKIHYEINSSAPEKRRNAVGWILKAAIVIILPLLVFWGVRGTLNYNQFCNSYAEIHSPAWTRTSFILPDGSKGWLNSRSSLKYKVNFLNDRHVELSGEGFFDVESDPDNPFSVSAGDIEVKVHGTKFNVAAWAEEDNLEIVLEEGEIELTLHESDSSFKLKPNQLAIYNRSDKKFTTEVVESAKFLAWTEGKLVFRNDPPEVLKRRLERWYNVDIEIIGSFHEDFRLRATFVDESLEDVLHILKRSLNIDYSIDQQSKDITQTYEKRKVKLYPRI